MAASFRADAFDAFAIGAKARRRGDLPRLARAIQAARRRRLLSAEFGFRLP